MHLSFEGRSGSEPPKQRTSIYLICSPQARVGKTLTARLLLDFFLSKTSEAIGFDTNYFEPRLAAVFPRQTTAVDLASTRGEMRLFDSLIIDDAVPKVADLWHVSYRRFFDRALELGFFEEARKRGIEPLILLHTDGKGWFPDEANTLLARWPHMDVTLVHNEGLVQVPYREGSRPVPRCSEQPVIVPELDGLLRSVLEEPEIRVHPFVRASLLDAHIGLEQRIRESLVPIFDQFERVELARNVRLPSWFLLPRARITPS